MIVAAGRLRGSGATGATAFAAFGVSVASLRRLRGNGEDVLVGMVAGSAESEATQCLERFDAPALRASIEEFFRRHVVCSIDRRAFTAVLADDYLRGDSSRATDAEGLRKIVLDG